MFITKILITFMLTECYGIPAKLLVQEQWEEYKFRYKKTFLTKDEDLYRMTIYAENMLKILKHNERYAMGETTYKMDMNKFGDLTDEEFSRFYQMSYDEKSDKQLRKNFQNYTYLNLVDDPPEQIDWRWVGAVTNVKEQGKCASCYAFSAIGALEAQEYFKSKKLVTLSVQNIVDCTYKIKTVNNAMLYEIGALEAQQYFKSKKLVSLSVQNIVDCTYKIKRYVGNNGCKGGRVDSTFQYIIDKHGIDTDKLYPYVGELQDECEFNPENVGAKMSSFVLLPEGNETELQRAVAEIGPVSVMVDSKNMRFYSAGIYEDPTCSSTVFDHGMLVVGYGIYAKYDYWLLKNSWGVDWGERGYMMMMRNKNNHCSIATSALYPVI